MSTRPSEVAGTWPLEILGISEAEERLYRWLVRHSDATVPGAAQALALTPGKAQRLLDAIEAKGLATHSPERPRRYLPVSPDIALKALAMRRQDELQRVEGVIQELQEEVASQRHGEQEQIVELITSRDAERQVLENMQRGARSEVVCLIRPPVLISRMDIPHEADQIAQREAQERGVRYRSIVDTGFLELPNAIKGMLDDIKAGEEVRVLPSLPFKLVMADHRIGLIPLVLEETSKHIVLLVRLSPLLDALYALFELLWAQAGPISFDAHGFSKSGIPPALLTHEGKRLISLLAAGLNDKRLAQEMGFSSATLTRRMSETMKALHARTRFQLGWLAHERLASDLCDKA